MAWLYIVALTVCAGLFLRYRLKVSARAGIGKAAAFLEPGNYITIHWLALFVVEASLVLLDPDNSQFRLAALDTETRIDAVTQAVLYGLGGYLCFAAGYLLPLKRLTSRSPYFSINSAPPVIRRGLVWVLMLIGLTGLAVFGFSEIASLLVFSANRTDSSAGQGYLFVLIGGWSIGLIISYAYLRFSGRLSYRVTAAYILAVMPMMAFGRTDFLFVVLAYMVISAYCRQPPKAMRLGLVGIAFIAVATLLLVARKYVGGFNADLLVSSSSTYGFEAARHTFVMFDNFANYMTVRGEPYWNYGIDYLFNYILYALPGNSLNPYLSTIPQTLMTNVYHSQGGAPFTILGITDVTMGPIGSVVFMFFFGMVTKVLWEYVRRHRSEISAILILALFDSRIHVVIWGSYISGMLQLVIAYLWLMLALVVLSRGVVRRPTSQRRYSLPSTTT